MSKEFESISDRLPPQNIEAEEAVLGGILIDPEAVSRVLDTLRPEMFYVAAHQEIFRACLLLHNQSNPTDMMSLTTWLSDRDMLEKIGGQTKICTNTASFTTTQTTVLSAFDYIIVTYQYAPPTGQDYDLDTLTTFRYPDSTLSGNYSSSTTGYVAGTGVVGCGTPSPSNVIPTSGANMNTSYLFWGGDDNSQSVDGTYGESVVINFKNLETSGLLAETNVIAELFAGWHSGPAGAYPISIKYQTFIGGTISYEVIGGIQTNRFVSTGTVVAAATSVPISVISGNCGTGVSIKRNMASITYNTSTNAATVTFNSY